MSKKFDLVIVGAGAAGLAASLAVPAPLTTLILEARDRVGGRAHTAVLPALIPGAPGLPVDLGAAWIHGHGRPGNPATALACDAGAALTRDSWSVRAGAVRLVSRSGRWVPQATLEAAAEAADVLVHAAGPSSAQDDVARDSEKNDFENASGADRHRDPTFSVESVYGAALDALAGGAGPAEAARQLDSERVSDLYRREAERVFAAGVDCSSDGTNDAGDFADAVRWFAGRYAQVEGTSMARLDATTWELGCDEGEGGLGDHMVARGYGELVSSMARGAVALELDVEKPAAAASARVTLAINHAVSRVELQETDRSIMLRELPGV
jgi:hypothetical protein